MLYKILAPLEIILGMRLLQIRREDKICEFNMYTEKYIDIREFDSLGRYKMTGWSLPKVAVEKLCS